MFNTLASLAAALAFAGPALLAQSPLQTAFSGTTETSRPRPVHVRGRGRPGQWAIPVPASPVFYGFAVHAQSLAFTDQNALQWSSSNDVVGRLGF